MSSKLRSDLEAVIAEVEGVLGEVARSVLPLIAESVWVLSPAAEVLYFNHAESTPVDLAGRRVIEFLKPEFHQEYEQNLGRVIAQGESVEFDFHSVIGQVWSQRFMPLRDASGTIRWALAFGHQVDTETTTIDNVRMSSGHVSVAIERSGIGFWRWDARTDSILLDERSCVIHGLDSDTESTKTMAEFLAMVHPDDQKGLRDVWSDIDRGEFRELEYRRVFPDGSNCWVMCDGSFLVSGSDAPPVVIGSFFDVTERKHVSWQMVQAQKMEAVGQLTAGIAHNFNNILSAILPNLHLASRHVNEDGAKFIRHANLAAERATDLVAELMVVAGRKEGQARVALDLYEICERVIRICRTIFGGWVQLDLNCDDSCALILGNESQIEQVLLNLLLNARDAFEEAAISCPRIDISLETSEEGEMILQVTDNGPGIAEEIQARIFEPFFTTKSSGTGLGLATVYAIVGNHGGTIRCLSKLDQGTCFELRLPAHDGELVAAIPEAPSSSLGGKESILVVDDDHLVRSVTALALRDAGYQVVEATGGSEALEAQRASLFDLVLLDMVMPDLPGDQVLEALRLRDPRIRVLVFTGLGSARVEQFDQIGLLQKPARINDLLAAVRREIDRPVIN